MNMIRKSLHFGLILALCAGFVTTASAPAAADGPVNLYNAAALAASKGAVGKGVLVALNDQISAGRDVTKANTSTADTFRSPDLGFLGYMQDNRAHFYRAPVRRHTLETEFDI